MRIKNISEDQRDEIIQEIFNNDVAVNVHFQPLPLLTAYKNLDYRIEKFHEAIKKYQNEISLPVYFNLNNNQVAQVVHAVVLSVEKILNKE